MFSVEYLNNTVIISAYNIRRINFKYHIRLRRLIVQAMKQSCKRIVLNMVGVRQFDNGVLDMVKLMSNIANSLGIRLIMMNVDEELCSHIQREAKEIQACLASETETEELADMLH